MAAAQHGEFHDPACRRGDETGLTHQLVQLQADKAGARAHLPGVHPGGAKELLPLPPGNVAKMAARRLHGLPHPVQELFALGYPFERTAVLFAPCEQVGERLVPFPVRGSHGPPRLLDTAGDRAPREALTERMPAAAPLGATAGTPA